MRRPVGHLWDYYPCGVKPINGYIFLDGILKIAYVRSVPLTEGVSGDEPESERDAASCARGS